MNRQININKQGEEINLDKRRYHIYILGGWGIDFGEFVISFKNIMTGEIAKCKRIIIPITTLVLKKRARRIFVVDIPKTANYEVVFDKSNTLEVKKSNLPISSMFMDSLSNEDLEIYVTEKFTILSFMGL